MKRKVNNWFGMASAHCAVRRPIFRPHLFRSKHKSLHVREYNPMHTITRLMGRGNKKQICKTSVCVCIDEKSILLQSFTDKMRCKLPEI